MHGNVISKLWPSMVFFYLFFLSILIFPPYWQDHLQSHGVSREPLLENITSDYDLELFRKAQARASDDLVRKQSHHDHLHFSFFSCVFWFQPVSTPLLPQSLSDYLVVCTVISCHFFSCSFFLTISINVHYFSVHFLINTICIIHIINVFPH